MGKDEDLDFDTGDLYEKVCTILDPHYAKWGITIDDLGMVPDTAEECVKISGRKVTVSIMLTKPGCELKDLIQKSLELCIQATAPAGAIPKVKFIGGWTEDRIKQSARDKVEAGTASLGEEVSHMPGGDNFVPAESLVSS